MNTNAYIYRPRLFNTAKYFIYLDYFRQYLAYLDFRSLGASLKYVFTHKLPAADYKTRSKMGNFFIRRQTTDFQFINYAYERKVKEYIKKNLDTFDVFIDAGACIGEYAVWLAKLGKKSIAIEPVNFEALKKNITLNQMEDHVQVFAVGLGSKKERVYFYVPEGVTGSSCLDRETKDKEPNVDIETLDDLSMRFNLDPGARILMKLDVEGMEPELIQGGGDFIRNALHLCIIYEHFIADNYRNDKALSAVADFTFIDLDRVNRLAIKS